MNVLESIDFIDVQPKIGFLGIDNKFYLIMNNFYEMDLFCYFYSNNSNRSPLIAKALIDNNQIYCSLPKNYHKRGFNDDDNVIL